MPQAQLGLSKRHQSPSFGVIWVERDGLLANAHDRLVSANVAKAPSDPILPGHQVEIVSLDTGSPALLNRFLFRRKQLYPQRCDNRLGDFVLDGENIREVAVVAVGPQVAPRRAVDQLSCD